MRKMTARIDTPLEKQTRTYSYR